MEKVTVEQVAKTIEDRNIALWAIRECSICGCPITYAFEDNHVSLDTNCGCVSYSTPPQIMDLNTFIEQTFNLQTKPDVRRKMWDRFIASGASQ